MPNACSICDLNVKVRKVAEVMLREGIGVRDVADFINWRVAKDVAPGETAPTVTKSAVDRHKNGTNGSGAHFVLEERKAIPTDAKFTTVEDIAREMVRRYGAQLEDPNWLPSDRDVREWASLMGKLNDLEQRRRDEEKLFALMAGATFKKPEAIPARVIDVTPKE